MTNDLTITKFNEVDRMFYIIGDIDTQMAGDFIKACEELIVKDKQLIEKNNHLLKEYLSDDSVCKVKIPDVNIILNTFGGICYAGFAIVDEIKKLNKHCKVNITVTGPCMSMGIPILLSVPYEQRFGTAYSTFMIHQTSTLAWGKCAELEDEVKESKRLNNLVYDIISNNTCITKEELEENYNKKEDWIIDSVNAMELKLISEIV